MLVIVDGKLNNFIMDYPSIWRAMLVNWVACATIVAKASTSTFLPSESVRFECITCLN